MKVEDLSMKLIIGSKNLSSWSLRPWLVLRYFKVPFEEELIILDQPDTEEKIAAHSPSGNVPALTDGDITIWDSLAICEYVNEKYPEKKMWPEDPKVRALARAISCEMHSGFSAMRTVMGHNLQLTQTEFTSKSAIDDIKRVKEIWSGCLGRFGGPFLFGSFTIADAMFAPVVNRFVSYAVPVDGKVQEYVKTMRNLEAFKPWLEAALKEPPADPNHR
jgi:glutathione S-transferase